MGSIRHHSFGFQTVPPIGRDVMARWNIVWDGPMSTVIISD